MKTQFQKIENKAREILLKDWDPIGVGEIQEAKDEYDLYLSGVCKIILEGKSSEDVFIYLKWVEENRIGLPFDENRARHAAKVLFDLRST